MADLLAVAVCSSVAMIIAWFWQQRHRNAGIVDVFWAFGMMLAGPWYAFTGPAPLGLQWVLAMVTSIWFLRLGSHLLRRFRSEKEDGRYQSMRGAMGRSSGIGFFLFFQLQAGFIWVLSLPFWAVAQNTQPKLLFVLGASGFTLLALWGETTADRQLAKFRGNPANRGLTCRDGWWRYSRHPNYFFEWLHWFAYPLLGIGSSYQYALWLAPVVMFCFLYFFTGIPFTERHALQSRGDNFRHYQKTTSAFFPWWPKTDRSPSKYDN